MGEWMSERRANEIAKSDRVKAFDKLVDMALDGWQGITVPQAIEAFKQEEGIYVQTPNQD